ncbi:uncharacterized protein [Branchiostoma lanceolatum]|uniref:uncharacterized protein n=1 Tax=Branchiostoma lanceolatum TaxID=7740 RepID=UPI0034534920
MREEGRRVRDKQETPDHGTSCPEEREIEHKGVTEGMKNSEKEHRTNPYTAPTVTAQPGDDQQYSEIPDDYYKYQNTATSPPAVSNTYWEIPDDYYNSRPASLHHYWEIGDEYYNYENTAGRPLSFPLTLQVPLSSGQYENVPSSASADEAPIRAVSRAKGDRTQGGDRRYAKLREGASDESLHSPNCDGTTRKGKIPTCPDKASGRVSQQASCSGDDQQYSEIPDDYYKYQNTATSPPEASNTYWEIPDDYYNTRPASLHHYWEIGDDYYNYENTAGRPLSFPLTLQVPLSSGQYENVPFSASADEASLPTVSGLDDILDRSYPMHYVAELQASSTCKITNVVVHFVSQRHPRAFPLNGTCHHLTRSGQGQLLNSDTTRRDDMRQFILTACLLGSLAVASSHIIPVSNAALYPYGPRTADILDARADDGTSGEQSLRIPFPFFGNTYNSLWVNTNGDISFGGAVTGYTPVAFPVTNNKVITAYFTDIKTNNHGRSGYIYRRETTDAGILARATTDIQTAYPADHGSFVATWVYVATWHEVGLYGASGDGQNLRNTFQLVLITNGCKSFTLLNYHQIQFLQGESNGGNGATGTGPNPAQVGINGGNGIHFTLHPYSKSTNLRHLPAWTDPAVPGPPGRWYRRTDLATIGDRPAVLVCPRSVHIKRRGDTCLKLHRNTLSYPDAKASCVRDGAELFNIRSRADNEWLTRLLRQWQR